MWWKKGIMILAVLMLSACSVKAETDITMIENVKENNLAELSTTYVGDNSKVLAIIQNLPGAETLKELNLQDEKIRITYGATQESLPQSDILAYWFDDNEAMEKNFLYNAIYLTLLVPNSKSSAFRLYDFSFEIEREEMVEVLSQKFLEFPSNDSEWNREVVGNFIRKNHMAIEEWVESSGVRKNFFANHPVIYNSH